MWEKDIDINAVREIRSKTLVYFGAGAIAKMDDIAKDLKARGISKVLAVTGHGSYKKTGAWDYVTKAFDAHGIAYTLYDGVTPNPKRPALSQRRSQAGAGIRGAGRYRHRRRLCH